MKNIIHLLIYLLVPLVWLNCYTQNNISSKWLINSIGDNWDVVSDQAIDKDGNIYLAGNFTSDIEIGENPTKLTGDFCFYISKVTSEGDVDWIKQISATKLCIINSISIDSSGPIYLCGNFKGELNFEGIQLISEMKKNAFILKLDTTGNASWGKQIDGIFRNKNIFISTDSQNNLFFTGSFSGELVIIDQSFRSKNFTDILLVKFNRDGEILNKIILTGKADDFVNDITTNQKNEVILTGSFEKDLIFFDQNLKSKGNKDAFLLRLDNKLNLMNIHQIGGAYNDYGKALSVDWNNNLLLVGSFTNKVYLINGHVLESNGKLDVFLIKLENTGKILWGKGFGGPANDYVSSVSTNSIGNIFITGSYHSHISIENRKIESKEFSKDVFLAKYDSQGIFQFMETIGNGNHDFGRILSLGIDDYIYLSGNYSNFLEVCEKESKSSESEEFFLTKLYDCELAKKVQLPKDTVLCATEFIVNAGDNFDQYFWNGQPGNNKLIIDSTGTYIIVAMDEHGCVSSDTIIVEFNKSPEVEIGDTIVVQQGEIVSLVAPSGMKEYLWDDGSNLSFLDVYTSDLDQGEYQFWVKVVDENECISRDEVLLIINNTVSEIDKLAYTGEDDLRVNISPNPARDVIKLNLINLNINSEIEICLYSIIGDQVLHFRTQSNTKNFNTTLQVGARKPGSYKLKVINGNKVIIKNIVLL